MRALILYAILVIIGTVVAAFVGLFVEREITDAGSVAVFIGLFFANFYVSWVITRTVVERTMKAPADEPTPAFGVCVMPHANVQENLVDARPILPVSESSLWNGAEERRDWIASRVEAQLEKLHIRGWVRKSQPGKYPVYIAVDVWRPVQETSLTGTFERSFLKITIEVEPYRENSTIYTVELRRHKKQYTASHWQMSWDELDEMVKYLVQGGTKPVFFKSRKPVIATIVSSFIPLPMQEYENNLIEEAKPTLTWLVALGWAGVIAAAGGFVTIYNESQSYYGPDYTGVGLAFGLAGLALVGTAWWLSSRRPVYQAIAKQPLHTPHTRRAGNSSLIAGR